MIHEEPIEPPPIIDAIRCRLEHEMGICRQRNCHVPVPVEEMKRILRILDAARNCVSEWEPTRLEKRSHGTGVGMRAAEDRLIQEIRAT